MYRKLSWRDIYLGGNLGNISIEFPVVVNVLDFDNSIKMLRSELNFIVL